MRANAASASVPPDVMKCALQAGTSHDLGQNFGKAFDVQFQSKEGQLDYVWQTSWGVSTRLMGGLIMSHSDDKGLVLPPKLAPNKAVLVPIFRKDDALIDRTIARLESYLHMPDFGTCAIDWPRSGHAMRLARSCRFSCSCGRCR